MSHSTQVVSYLAIEAEPPSLQDNTADIDRLKKAIAHHYPDEILHVPFACISTLSSRFRDAGFEGTVVLNDLSTGGFEIVDFCLGQPKVLAVMAIDLGTTHIEASLLDLLSGQRLATAHGENSQIAYGPDVLSRIHFAGHGEGLYILHQKVLGDINELTQELADQAGLDPLEIRALSLSGNPTMVHLFLNLDPQNICREPYIPVINYPDPFKANELDLKIHPVAPVCIMPGVGSYFGGDLISGIISTGLDQQEETSMLIDVGTNAEVVLGNSQWLIACAGAAGPALESGVARMGMRAGPGAIEHIEVDPNSNELICHTIGNDKPIGICGSGIIDLGAALYLTRVIDARGKFREEGGKGRLPESSDGKIFTVVPGDEDLQRKAVVIGQVDLDSLMRSKAAMYAILTTIMNQVGVEFAELHRIYVAGAFGRHIDPRQAITLGMLPDLPIETYESVGNSSLKGAEMLLLDGEARARCQNVVHNITYVELNVNQEFMMRFSGSKFIPHTDCSLFPSVPVFK